MVRGTPQKNWLKRDDLLLTADSKLKELEYRRFLELRTYCSTQAAALADIARRVASIDVLQCFASVSRERNWTKPEITDKHQIQLEGLATLSSKHSPVLFPTMLL